MRLAFITDFHLGPADFRPQGIDVRQNWLDALAHVRGFDPLGLILGGDLTETPGDRDTYRWIKQQLDQLPFPWYAISGNHDDSAVLAEELHLTHHLQGNELYYALPLEGYPTLFLDSAKGELSAGQWTWLRESLQALRDHNVLVFMHHPPVLADAHFMDEHYAFRQRDQFVELVKDLPCHVTVVCGHYHTERTIQRGNLLTLITPSTYLQIRPDTTGLTFDKPSIGIREISISTNGLTSSIQYL